MRGRRSPRACSSVAFVLAGVAASGCGSSLTPSGPDAGEGGWSRPEIIGGGAEPLHGVYGTYYAPDVRISMDDAGSAIAVWEEYSPGAIMANRYLSGRGWQGLATIRDGSARVVADPHIGMDASGNAVVVWGECCPYWKTWACRYRPGLGWGTRQDVQPVPSATYSSRYGVSRPLGPRVLVDDAGNGLVFWSQSDPSRPQSYPEFPVRSLSARPFSSANVWGTPRTVVDEQAYSSAALAMTPRGDALAAAWGRLGVFAAWYRAESGWQAPVPLAPYPANYPDAAVNSAGSAVVVWRDLYAYGTVYPSLWAAAFGPLGWEAPVVIARDVGNTPTVAFDDRGVAIAVWAAKDRGSLWASRLEPGSGWGEPRRIGGAIEAAPSVAVDPDGNFLVVWKGLPEETFVVWSARLDARGDWSAPERVDLGPSAVRWASPPSLAVGRQGDAIAAWSRIEGPRVVVYASRRR